jgi:large repetitive protein
MTISNSAALWRAISVKFGNLTAVALIALTQTQFVSSATAQGAALANCALSAGTSIITCTTTSPLTGVAAPAESGTLTLRGAGVQGPVCSGGLTANPQTGLPPNVATAIALTACAQSADRASFDYRWVPPAVSGGGVGLGSATATLAAGQSVTYSVDVCASTAANALCTRATTSAITPAGPPVCAAISPSQQTVSPNAVAAALNANCAGATSYQWFSGASPATGTLISGATNATYAPPTSVLGTFTYSVRATNATGTTDNTSNATVIVAGGSACPVGSGNPRVTVTFTQPAQNFVRQNITGSAFGTLANGAGTHITQITVGPTSTDTTLNHRYLATWGIVQEDTTTFSNRTISLSQICGDFSADKIVLTNTQDGNFELITVDDAARASATRKVVTPGVWYINVRNDTCPDGANCSITGIYTNRNR